VNPAPPSMTRRIAPVTPSCDTIIIGAGLAGASSAYHLSRSGQQVVVLDTNELGRPASGVGGGLANPMMARKGRPVWMAEEALHALETMGIETQRRLPGHSASLFRPAKDERQADDFREQARLHPDFGRFREGSNPPAELDYVQTDYGVLEVTQGAALDLGATAAGWLEGIETHSVAADWRIEGIDDGVVVATSLGEIRANRLLLCLGAAAVEHPLTASLNLERIKGQIIRVKKPDGLPDTLPPLSGAAYLVDDGHGGIWIGSTFERNWETTGETTEAVERLLERAGQVIPSLSGAEVLEQRVGFRVTVPGTRLPMVGPLQPESPIWVLAGLGSRGSLYSALFGSRIPVFFNVPEAIPARCGVVHRSAES